MDLSLVLVSIVQIAIITMNSGLLVKSKKYIISIIKFISKISKPDTYKKVVNDLIYGCC